MHVFGRRKNQSRSPEGERFLAKTCGDLDCLAEGGEGHVEVRQIFVLKIYGFVLHLHALQEFSKWRRVVFESHGLIEDDMLANLDLAGLKVEVVDVMEGLSITRNTPFWAFTSNLVLHFPAVGCRQCSQKRVGA